MEIRYMRAGGAAEVSVVYARSWRYAYRGIVPQDYLNGLSDARWVNNLSRNEMKNLVMVEDGVIIGTTGLCKSRWASYEAYGEIVSIYLLPEYIGKGYGKQLLFSAIAELEQMRFQDILLWVLAENHSARKFYEIHEFTPSGETQTGIIGGKQNRTQPRIPQPGPYFCEQNCKPGSVFDSHLSRHAVASAL